MIDDTEGTFSFCADLVTSEHTEIFPLALLTTCSPGNWVSVNSLCTKLGLNAGVCSNLVFSTWLPDPLMSSDYVVIVFYDSHSVSTFSAHYNRTRLFGTPPTKEAQR
jgi:hypothetical protein